MNKWNELKPFQQFMAIILGIFILILIPGLLFGGEEETKPAFEDLNDDQKVMQIIDDTIDLKTNHDDYENRVKQYSFSEDKTELVLELVASDNFSNSNIKNGIFFDTADVMAQLKLHFPNLTYVDFQWYFPLVDTYGNEELETVIQLSYEQETINKTNWDNVLSDNVATIADFKFIHPALEE